MCRNIRSQIAIAIIAIFNPQIISRKIIYLSTIVTADIRRAIVQVLA